jgi:hypothetical protein
MTETKRSIQLTIFAYTGEVHCAVKNAMVAGMTALASERDWPASIAEIIGDAMLPRSRNTAVSLCRASAATDLIMCDADNYCSPADLVKLLDHDVDLVGAACRSRTEPLRWPVRWKHNGAIARSANGLIDVESVGTGIIRFSRNCLERMCEAYKDEWYVDDSSPTGKTVALFEYERRNRHWWGEDVTFCNRWRAIGGQVWIDPDIETRHIGTVEFTHSVAKWLGELPPNINLASPESGLESKVKNLLSLHPSQTEAAA